ncbi:MAG: diguanylate cyclase [Actinobacteria bacterium]|nr:diguanylate cyclase [Actinomycetota bacterium]
MRDVPASGGRAPRVPDGAAPPSRSSRRIVVGILGIAPPLRDRAARAIRSVRLEPRFREAASVVGIVTARDLDIALVGVDAAPTALAAAAERDDDIPVVVLCDRIPRHETAAELMRLGAADVVTPLGIGWLGAVVERERQAAWHRRSVRRSQRLNATQRRVSRLLASDDSPTESLPDVLGTIAASLGWATGALWQVAPQGDALRCAATWTEDVAFEDFLGESRSLRLARGEELPGRVWAADRAQWSTDLAGHSPPPRAAHAVRTGLISAIGFPLLVGESVLGILEFFSRATLLPDRELLDLFASIGADIARYLALHESRARLEGISQTTADAIVVVDEIGRVMTWNPGAERMFGRSGVEARGLDLAELFARRHRDGHRERLARAVADDRFAFGGRPMHLHGLRRDGAEFPIELSLAGARTGNEVSFSAIIRDTTESLRARRALDEFKGTLDAARDGIIIIDPQANRLAYANRAAEELLGRSEAELLELGPADLVDRLPRGSQTGFLSGVRRPDATLVPVEISTQHIAPSGGRARSVWIVRDIADRLRAEQALQQSRDRNRALTNEGDALRQLTTELAELAARDSLTGLANHRTFHERLAEEFDRAKRYGEDMALVVIDIDDFKRVNNVYGHQAGDEVLKEAASRFVRRTRSSDVVAHVGGEEFAVLLPSTSGMGAFALAEGMRRAMCGEPFAGVGRLTISCGIADVSQAADAHELLRLADGALYWAKGHGRDVVFRYSPDVVQELSLAERAARLERNGAFTAVRVLARAVDARDASTQAHSERVAELAARLAKACGWSDECVGELNIAGLVHDVGKIGIPDAVLLKPGALTAEEFEQIKAHSALGAEMLSGVLAPHQVAWVRGHHERVDGRGYPDGLVGDAIPEGARLLCVADCWDAMTADRPYRSGLSPDAALAECRSSAGTQFDPRFVEALIGLDEAGELRPISSTIVQFPLSAPPGAVTSAAARMS